MNYLYAMLEQLRAWDEQLLLFLNGLNAPWLDTVAFWLTKTECWIPLYALLLYLIFSKHKKEAWFVLAGIALSLVLSDQITSGIMKPFFERLRPSHEPGLEGVLHIVNGYRGGLYGFVSSHAANTAGVALFVFLLFRSVYRYAWTIFVWAAVVSYTRIYLGVHYPGDVFIGVLVGLACGFAGFRFYGWLKTRVKKKSPGSETVGS